MISKEEIENTLSNTLIPPPKHIYIIKNAYITAHSPISDFGKTLVLGMHPIGKEEIILTATSHQENLIHESIHNLGISNEFITRLLTRVVMFRNNFPRLITKQVKYHEVPVNKEEIEDYIRSHYLQNLSSDKNIELVHLELIE
ncbi:MAG: hypothetical protein QW260_08365 [Thermoproteota archaeon]